jgi:beta-N-acetylhexosaminidase
MCGQLVVGGFEGTALPESFARALEAGERGGAILFARNLTGDPMHAAELARAIALRAQPRGTPPIVAVDQEGGRVARFKEPLLVLPPMRAIAELGDVGLAEDAARAQGAELAALGFTMNFAPVLDVNTRAENPIIGDRAFGDTADVCARFGVAWARGLEAGGVLACGKHFPGHGDTSKDSHLDLPVVDRDRAHLDAVDLAPFRAAAMAGVAVMAAMMTAHVVYPALDAGVPATLSRAICTDLARREVGFEGWLVSDDLEMKAIADRYSIEEAAVRAIGAGCDAVLVCRSEELQARAVEGLVRRAAEDATLEARCREAAERGFAMRRRVTPRPVRTRAELDAVSAQARDVAARLAARRGRVA